MDLGYAILIFVAATVGSTVAGMMSKWVDRKVTARVQWRVGPPWFQPFADVCKLLGKETILPSTAKKWTFLLAPVMGFAGTAVAVGILWAVNIQPTVGFIGDLIVVLYLLTVPSLSLILGASASGSPVAALGASREMKLLLAYELPFVLVLVAVIVKAHTLTFSGILGWQAAHGMMVLSPSCILGFLVALLCMQAKLGLVPFDMPEAEAELMAGILTEYSGTPLAMITITRALLTATLPIFLITVFWGGFSLTGLGPLWGVLEYVGILVVSILIRNTNPRLRIDQAVKFFWFGLAPVAALAVVLAALGM